MSDQQVSVKFVKTKIIKNHKNYKDPRPFLNLISKGRLFVLLTFLIPLFTYAQNDTLPIPDRSKFNFFSPDTSAFKRSFSLVIDNRNSFIKNRPVNIYGIGLEYQRTKNIQWGWGIFMINRAKYNKEKAALDKKPIPDFHLYYTTPNFTYTFLNTRWFEFSVPIEMGLGYATFKLTDPISSRTFAGKTWFIPAEAGVSGLFKINRWLGLNASFGYRQILWQSTERIAIKGPDETRGKMNMDFDGIYYKYGVNVFFGTIIKDIKAYRAQRK